MREVIEYFDERKSEFSRHVFVARLLEARINDEVAGDDAQIEVRHVNTLKSGLLIHLYNIVEAVMTQTMKVVGRTVINDKPRFWTEAVLKEWVRAAIWDGDDRLGDAAVARLVSVSGVLASGDSPESFVVKGEPGSWDDAAIKKVSARLGCQLVLAPAIRRAAFERVYLNEMTAMQYLATRRNAIAHGATTFEAGASGNTLDEIESLAGRIFPFLGAVTASYDAFLAAKTYLASQDAAA